MPDNEIFDDSRSGSDRSLLDTTQVLQDFLDGLPLGIALLGLGGRILYHNLALRDLIALHHDPDGLGISEVIDLSALGENGAVLADGRSTDLVCPVDDGDPLTERMLRIRSIPLNGSGTSGVRSAVLLEDVTESERLKRHLSQAQRMESVGSLASSVAHDINNILTAILSSVHLLKDSEPRVDSIQEPLNTIERTALSAAQLAGQLLTLARQRVVSPIPLSISSVVLEARDLLDRVLAEDIHLDLDLERQAWTVTADPAQILHTLVNLCLNAQEAMGGRGHITVNTRNVDRSQSLRRDGDLPPGFYVLLAVTDEGPGIPTGIADRVFDPFFTTKQGGTGLGLSTAYSMARDQGGTVTLYSEPGQGTTIKVYFAAEPTTYRVETVVTTEPPPSPSGTETILLVDDEPLLLELGSEILERKGYRVLTAASGQEALERHADSAVPIPLAILDMAMPGMSGLETIRALRAQDPHIKVILSSGFHPSSRVESLLGTEVDALVNKPYEIPHLIGEVRRVLDENKTSP